MPPPATRGALRVATLDEVLRFGSRGGHKALRARGLLPPIAGGAPPALVGSAGTFTSAGATSTTPTWGTGENRTAGNLLVCAFFVNSTTLPTISAGWTLATPTTGFTSIACGVFYTIATGGDAAPTVTSTANNRAGLMEFSGAGLPDQSAVASGTGLTATATAAAADVAPGELVIYIAWANYSVAAANTLTHTPNNGAVFTSPSSSWTNSGLSSVTIRNMGYGITTGNSAADSDQAAVGSTTNLSGLDLTIVSFQIPAPSMFAPRRMPLGV